MIIIVDRFNESKRVRGATWKSLLLVLFRLVLVGSFQVRRSSQHWISRLAPTVSASRGDSALFNAIQSQFNHTTSPKASKKGFALVLRNRRLKKPFFSSPKILSIDQRFSRRFCRMISTFLHWWLTTQEHWQCLLSGRNNRRGYR